jgi:hypothetical protein
MLRQTLEQGGIKTLSDFVDQESINEVVTRATISFQQLKVRSNYHQLYLLIFHRLSRSD